MLRIMMHSKMMPSIMMLSKMTFSIITLIKTIFNKMTLSIMTLVMSKEYTTLSIMMLSSTMMLCLLTLDTQRCYAESHISLLVMLSVGAPERELNIRSKIKDRNM
jgi:hypothetical protein